MTHITSHYIYCSEQTRFPTVRHVVPVQYIILHYITVHVHVRYVYHTRMFLYHLKYRSSSSSFLTNTIQLQSSHTVPPYLSPSENLFYCTHFLPGDLLNDRFDTPVLFFLHNIDVEEGWAWLCCVEEGFGRPSCKCGDWFEEQTVVPLRCFDRCW
jgi:hypothetical protein